MTEQSILLPGYTLVLIFVFLILILLLFLEGELSLLDTIHNIAVPAQIAKSTPGIINK